MDAVVAVVPGSMLWRAGTWWLLNLWAVELCGLLHQLRELLLDGLGFQLLGEFHAVLKHGHWLFNLLQIMFIATNTKNLRDRELLVR